MTIDWFTFLAQIVNFLVLVALLRWLLYDRIVRAMQRREEGIAHQLQEANAKRAEAASSADEYQARLRAIEEQRENLLQEARGQADREYRQLLQDARQSVDRQRTQWQAEFQREQVDLRARLSRRAGEMGLEVARRALSQLADADLEQQTCNVFAARIRQMSHVHRQELAQHLANGKPSIAIRSAFDIPEEQQQRLRQVVQESLHQHGTEIAFVRSGELICGIELEAGGYRCGWNVDEFLRDLEQEFNEPFQAAG